MHPSAREGKDKHIANVDMPDKLQYALLVNYELMLPLHIKNTEIIGKKRKSPII